MKQNEEKKAMELSLLQHTKDSRGYYVVRILPEERRQRAVSAAYDARTASPPEGQMDR